MGLLHYLLFLSCFFNVVFAEEVCNCKDPAYESTWGEFTATSRCDGKCNGLIRGVQNCYSSLDGLIQKVQRCHVERHCQNPDSCEGYWSPWGNIGGCGVSCKQRQARYCYKNGTSFLLRNKYCLESNGETEQNRLYPCNHGACDPTRTVDVTTTTTVRTRVRPIFTRLSSPPSTLSSTPSTVSITNSTYPLGDDVTSTYVAQTKSNRNGNVVTVVAGSGEVPGDLNGVTLRQSENDDVTPEEDNTTILLIAILGSVGLICVAVVILGLAIVNTRKRRNRTQTASAHNMTYEDGTINLKNASYETVGPALPDRPPFRSAPSPKKLDSIYEAAPDKEHYFHSKQSGTDADNYLLPLPYSSEEELRADQEAIYCKIDENK